jgi:hypothetical protein
MDTEFGYLPTLPPGINVRQNVLRGRHPAGSVANSKQNYWPLQLEIQLLKNLTYFLPTGEF